MQEGGGVRLLTLPCFHCCFSPRDSLILVLAGGRPAGAGRLVRPCLVGTAEQSAENAGAAFRV